MSKSLGCVDLHTQTTIHNTKPLTCYKRASNATPYFGNPLVIEDLFLPQLLGGCFETPYPVIYFAKYRMGFISCTIKRVFGALSNAYNREFSDPDLDPMVLRDPYQSGRLLEDVSWLTRSYPAWKSNQLMQNMYLLESGVACGIMVMGEPID
jgi:hypothetical protein